MSCTLPKEADPESMDSFGIITLAGIEGRNYGLYRNTWNA